MLLTIQTTKREEEHYSTQRQTQLSQQPARVGNAYLGTPTQAQPKNSGGKALVTSPQREVKIFTPTSKHHNPTKHNPPHHGNSNGPHRARRNQKHERNDQSVQGVASALKAKTQRKASQRAKSCHAPHHKRSPNLPPHQGQVNLPTGFRAQRHSQTQKKANRTKAKNQPRSRKQLLNKRN